MGFNITKEALKKSQKCPPGMHVGILASVEEPYYNEKGTNIQKADFETESGYTVPKWFNDGFMGDLIEFIEAADGIKFDPETMQDVNIDLKDYEGKKVAFSVSHAKDKNNKVQAQIDNFFTPGKVPF